jgi:glutamate synthase (NADPH/NADH) large chain
MHAPRDEDVPALHELIEAYAHALSESGQQDAAAHVRSLLEDPGTHFRVVRPGADITDQTISTE